MLRIKRYPRPNPVHHRRQRDCPVHEGPSPNAAVRVLSAGRADPRLSLLPEYETVNVLSDNDIRQGIKEFSDWPTIPQLYVKGEFVGGCDIVVQMYQNGRAVRVARQESRSRSSPRHLTVTDGGGRGAQSAAEPSSRGMAVRLMIDANFRPGMDLDQGAARSSRGRSVGPHSFIMDGGHRPAGQRADHRLRRAGSRRVASSSTTPTRRPR